MIIMDTKLPEAVWNIVISDALEFVSANYR